MKIGIFTTQTTHHTYFVREIKKIFKDIVAFCETTSINHPFNTHHVFEDQREDYECRHWFEGKKTSISDLVPTQTFTSLNNTQAIRSFAAQNIDVVIVFGTGLLKKDIIDFCPFHTFNLHGGNPEEYRGLDSHLWAIYHRDFKNLITTLHRLDKDLDSGDIVLQECISLHENMPFHALRAANTEVCVKLTIAALDMVARFGRVLSRPQGHLGRYYSAMPSELKDLCKKRFESHINKSFNHA